VNSIKKAAGLAAFLNARIGPFMVLGEHSSLSRPAIDDRVISHSLANPARAAAAR
jgi:hypothetical protein